MKKILTKIKAFFRWIFSKKYTILCFILLCFVLFMNLIFLIPGLSDFYTLYIYPVWLNTYGRIASVLPLSLAEIVIFLAICFFMTLLVSLIILIFRRKSKHYKKYMMTLLKITVMAVLIDSTLQSFSVPAFRNAPRLELSSSREDYTVGEMKILRDYIGQKCNEFSLVMTRDDNGYVIYDKSYVQESKKAMRNISSSYPKLKGYYPNAKGMVSSRFQTLTRCMGVTYFDTLSVNYNKECYSLFIVSTITHEYAHIKGYYKEDEANFLAYLACILYDDAFFQYAGYISVLDYVNYDYYCSAGDSYSSYNLNDYVKNDDTAFDYKALKEIEESPIDSGKIGDISNDISDINIKINGDSSGIASYSYVTHQLLKYYDGILY